MTDLLAQIDGLAVCIGSAPQLSASQANAYRVELAGLRRRLAADFDAPAPDSISTVGGATITHRPDLAHDERARQAAVQGDAGRGGYLPAQQTTLQPGGAGGTMQAPAPKHPAELAKIGTDVR